MGESPGLFRGDLGEDVPGTAMCFEADAGGLSRLDHKFEVEACSKCPCCNLLTSRKVLAGMSDIAVSKQVNHETVA